MVPQPGKEICDFCVSAPKFKVYACCNFVIPWTKRTVFEHEPIGEWAACHKCSEMIDADRWAELTERALRKFVKKHSVPGCDQQLVWEQLGQIHQLFREHMIRED